MRIWFNKHFQGTFRHVNALVDTGLYEILVSHDKESVPVMQSGNNNLSRDGVKKFKEEEFQNIDGYVDWCLSFCESEKVGLFIPGKGKEQIEKRYNEFKKIGTKVLVASDAKTMFRLDQKDKFLKDVEGLVPTAPWRVFKTRKEFDKAWKELGAGEVMDLCVKPVQGIYGSGFWKLTNEVSNMQLFTRLSLPVSQFLERVGEGLPEKWLLMQYCADDERSVDCVAHRGELICAVIRRKRKNGVQEIEENQEIFNYTKTLVKKFKLSGLVNVQFKEHAGVMNILEINPRASGGSGMAYLANASLMPLAVEAFLNDGKVKTNATPGYGMKIQSTQQYFVVQGEGDDSGSD